MMPTTSDAGVRGALAACVLALVACVVVSLSVSSPSDADTIGPVRATVSDAEPGAGDQCLPISGSGSYTSGRTLLANTSESPVEITDVRIEGARDIHVDQAYAVPAADGTALGNAPRWPPGKDQVRSAPGWLNRVRAVGTDRLGPIGDETDPGAASVWNLVLHLVATGPLPSYDAVVVTYRAGGTSHTTRATPGLTVPLAACP